MRNGAGPAYWIAALSALTLLAGCSAAPGAKSGAGITYYCPGAGNYDFGDVAVRHGLERSGYQGEVVPFFWTCSFNIAIDQMVRDNPRQRARELARQIMEFSDKNPGTPINLVGFSAGTGVAVWALENLRPGYTVNEVVLLASSLSAEYDMRSALNHVRGHVYVYHSDRDAMLAGPVRLVGTIDGAFNADAAGRIGLLASESDARIVNIGWRREWERLGNYGGHSDQTNVEFVTAEVAPRLLPVVSPQADPSRAPQPAFASLEASALPDAAHH